MSLLHRQASDLAFGVAMVARLLLCRASQSHSLLHRHPVRVDPDDQRTNRSRSVVAHDAKANMLPDSTTGGSTGPNATFRVSAGAPNDWSATHVDDAERDGLQCVECAVARQKSGPGSAHRRSGRSSRHATGRSPSWTSLHCTLATGAPSSTTALDRRRSCRFDCCARPLLDSGCSSSVRRVTFRGRVGQPGSSSDTSTVVARFIQSGSVTLG